MGHIAGKFADQDSYVVTAQIITSNNNQAALNAALAESDHLRASSTPFVDQALTRTLANPVPIVTTATTLTIGAALGDIGQQGTPSQEEGGGGEGGPPCPEIHQFVRIRSEINTPIPVQVLYIEKGMYLWNPLSGEFEKLISAEIVEDQDLWGLMEGNEVVAEGSSYHPLIQSLDDTKGTYFSALKEFSFVQLLGKTLCESGSDHSLEVKDLQRKGKVKRLETAGPGHIYAAGTQSEEMYLFHNLKPLEGG